MFDLADMTLDLLVADAPRVELAGWHGLCIVDRCAGRATPTGLCAGHDERMAHAASAQRADRAMLEQWTGQDRARHERRLERSVR